MMDLNGTSLRQCWDKLGFLHYGSLLSWNAYHIYLLRFNQWKVICSIPPCNLDKTKWSTIALNFHYWYGSSIWLTLTSVEQEECNGLRIACDAPPYNHLFFASDPISFMTILQNNVSLFISLWLTIMWHKGNSLTHPGHSWLYHLMLRMSAMNFFKKSFQNRRLFPKVHWCSYDAWEIQKRSILFLGRKSSKESLRLEN